MTNQESQESRLKERREFLVKIGDRGESDLADMLGIYLMLYANAASECMEGKPVETSEVYWYLRAVAGRLKERGSDEVEGVGSRGMRQFLAKVAEGATEEQALAAVRLRKMGDGSIICIL